MKITPIQRAQVMLETLSANMPDTYRDALALIRNHTGEAQLAGRPGLTAACLRLPSSSNRLLRELRNHLNAIILSPAQTFAEDALCLEIIRLLPPMPIEFESEQIPPEATPSEMKNRPLEEEEIVRLTYHTAVNNGFDFALLVQIKNRSLNPQPVACEIEDAITDEMSEVESVRRADDLWSEGVRVLGESTIEWVADGSQSPIWKLVLIIRILDTVEDKRLASLSVQNAIMNMNSVENVQFLRLWDDGLDCRCLWTKSGRKIVQLCGRV